MREGPVFISIVIIASCGGVTPMPPPPPPSPVPIVRHRLDAAVPDAPAAPQVSARGGACGTDLALCAADQTCLRDLPGGYCASRCSDVGDDRACGDGTACVPTPRDGDVCARACAADADCRADEGYTCDPVYGACLMPGFAALAVRRCPPAKLLHDAAFGASEILPSPARAPATVLTAAGLVIPALPLESLVRVGGDVLAGALRDHGERPSIQLVTSADRGATWSAPRAASDPADCADDDPGCPEHPRLAAGPRALYLAYSSDAIGTRVRASRDRGATWGPAATALTGARGDLAASADGRVHVIAMTGGTGGAYGSAQHALEYTVSLDGGRTFQRPPSLVSARDEILPAYFGNPTLALDERRGWIYVAYARGGGDAAWAIVVAASKDRGRTWARTRVADDGCSWASTPALAVDPTTGAVHVAWYDTRGPAPGRFAHARCAAGATRCAELGAIETVPFAALDAGRDSARWIGDAASLVIDDRRRLLHATWTEPLAEGDRVATRALHATAKLPVR